jgi:hypothetical protein
LADESVQALRALFESDHPEYYGRHINFSEALFSPRPKTPIPIVLGGGSRAALRSDAHLGDGWYRLRVSPEAAGEAIAVMNQIGFKRDFTMSLRSRPGLVDRWTAPIPRPPSMAATQMRSSGSYGATAKSASSNWSSNPFRRH